MPNFASLPQHNLQYPIVHYPSIQQRAIIPTAEYAAQLARTASAVWSNLSPEERARKQAELDLMGARVREHNMATEWTRMRLDQYQKQQAIINDENKRLRAAMDARRGRRAAITDTSVGTSEPKPSSGVPDTNPFDYYGMGGEADPDSSGLTPEEGSGIFDSPTASPSEEVSANLPTNEDEVFNP